MEHLDNMVGDLNHNPQFAPNISRTLAPFATIQLVTVHFASIFVASKFLSGPLTVQYPPRRPEHG